MKGLVISVNISEKKGTVKTPIPEILIADFIKIFWWDLKKLFKDYQNKHLILNPIIKFL